MKNNIIAIMYDFDKTLCTKDMQEYTFIPNLGIDSSEFWQNANKLREEDKMDQVLTYMYLMVKKTEELGYHLTRDYLNKMGKDIELFPGVNDWFKRINEYGREKGVTIEHYIISSGVKEIIEGSVIGNNFKKIFASEFYYDNSGHAVWPKAAINYTNKTQFLMRINKGILDTADDVNINKKMDEIDRRIAISNMIYIGDGLTDVPCMKLTKDGGGVSIAVYTDKSEKIAKSLLNDERINYMTKADYRESSKIDLIVKKTIDAMAINTELNNLIYKDIAKTEYNMILLK